MVSSRVGTMDTTSAGSSRWAKMSVRLNNLAKRVEVHKLNKIIFNWPMPRQEWIDGKFVEHAEKNDEAWVELFIDLIYVVLLSSLANQLEVGNLSFELYVKIASSFWIICLTRQAIDEYSNRFYCHDFVQKCIYLVYTIAVFIQASSIQFDFLHQVDRMSESVSSESGEHDDVPVVHHDDVPVVDHASTRYLSESSSEHRATQFYSPTKLYSSGFAISLLITRMCLLTMYAVVIYRHNVARRQFQFDIFRWSVTSILMAVLLVLNAFDINSNGIDLAFFIAVVAVEFLTWIISRVFYRHLFIFPVNLGTLQARWGIWVMIVIGESVIQLLHSFISLKGIYFGLRFMGVSLLLLFTLAMQYFDACQVEWYEHALTKSALAGVSWIWLHVPMTLHLFRFGVWLKILATSYSRHEELDSMDAAAFSISLGLVSCLITVIRMSNSLPDSSISLVDHILSAESRSVLIFAFRIIISAFQFGLGYAGIKNAMTLLAFQCGCTLLTTAIDVLNDITTASENSKEEMAKEAVHVAIKSLKHFPRQWSHLQLVKKESLLEMNIMSEDGDIAHSILSAKSHLTEDRAAEEGFGSLHRTLHSSHSLISLNLKKLIENEITRAELKPSHFDGLLMRKNSGAKSMFSTPSQLMSSIASVLPPLVEKKEVESSSQYVEELEDHFGDADLFEECTAHISTQRTVPKSQRIASKGIPSSIKYVDSSVALSLREEHPCSAAVASVKDSDNGIIPISSLKDGYSPIFCTNVENSIGTSIEPSPESNLELTSF